MKSFLISIIKYILFFLLIFLVGRLIFIVYNWSDVQNESFGEILFAFYAGIRMDVSALSYFSPIALLLLFIRHQFNRKWAFKLLTLLVGIIVLVYFSIVLAELPIYDEWMTKLNSKALSYLSNPTEVWRTATLLDKIMALLVAPWLSLVSVWFFKQLYKNAFYDAVAWYKNISIFLVSLMLGFVGARGGFYQIPLSVGGVFYSENRTLNFATVNSFWNLGYSTYKDVKYREEDKYKFFTEKALEAYISPIKNRVQNTPKILKTERPNIIVILFESWSYDLVDSLDRMYNLMPRWRTLKKESIQFTNCFATGRHSEEGMLAVFAGFPSLASSYLMGFTEKNGKLPTINKILANEDYHQAFLFGGDLGYANIKSFFYQNPFETIKDEMNFSNTYKKGKLGYHDDALYGEMFKTLNSIEQPFLVGGFTTSTHSPYDAPMKFIQYTSNENEYINTAHYADSCLGDFIDKIKLEEWYNNTLLVLVSDHSHPTPIKRSYCSDDSHRIVFMLSGGAIKDQYKGIIVDKIVSQIDIPATILAQMNLSSQDLNFSRNVLDSAYQSFAYFSDKTCQGVVNDKGYVKYSLPDLELQSNKMGEQADSVSRISQSFLQKSYQYFRDL
ncbi:MAG: sulfatase-like hydrolase/transferase [Bacteroidales bacterium]|nr:sulfatase-like hydrolase/transferase [Bacteroidales bacterium]